MNKEKILAIINRHHPKSVRFSVNDLRFAFAFKRVDGLAFSIMKMNNPNLTEEQASYTGPGKMNDNIKEWCEVNRISFIQDLDRDTYTFYKLANTKRDGQK